jgi:hypothetical protein
VLSDLGSIRAAAITDALTKSRKLDLQGFVLGREKTVGVIHWLQAASGAISPLGNATVAGFLVIPIIGGDHRPVFGSVTISNAQGSLVVSLTGTVTVSTGPFTFASGKLSYRIISGTKAYLGATGGGPVLYGPGPVFQPGRYLLDFGNATPPP